MDIVKIRLYDDLSKIVQEYLDNIQVCKCNEYLGRCFVCNRVFCRNCYRDINNCFMCMNINEVMLMENRIWFDCEYRSVNLFERVTHISLGYAMYKINRLLISLQDILEVKNLMYQLDCKKLRKIVRRFLWDLQHTQYLSYFYILRDYEEFVSIKDITIYGRILHNIYNINNYYIETSL